MSSKYIIKSRIKAPLPIMYEWSSDAVNFDKVVEGHKNPLIAEKERIEAIHLEQLSFTDLYALPFHVSEYGSWVYDAKGNFIFQFEFKGDDTRKQIIDILNGDLTTEKEREVKEDQGMILLKLEDEFKPLILIRGWGNLTGVGAYNLDGEYAGKIQDTLSEYIVQKLSGKP